MGTLTSEQLCLSRHRLTAEPRRVARLLLLQLRPVRDQGKGYWELFSAAGYLGIFDLTSDNTNPNTSGQINSPARIVASLQLSLICEKDRQNKHSRARYLEGPRKLVTIYTREFTADNNCQLHISYRPTVKTGLCLKR